MAATVGELVVNLTARTGAFNKGLQASERRVTTFGSRIGATAKKVVAFGTAMAGVGSAMAVAHTIKSQLELMDSTGKLADRLGITTEKLQGLRHAAELTGAGADTLDAGLQTMAKRLGEAARGAGAAKPALQELGLSAQQLVRLPIDQQFYRIAQAIARIEEPAKRAAITANIFSKANMSLETTLAEGAMGLAKMQEEAEKLGITFSRDLAAGAEKANDAITRLKAAWTGYLMGGTKGAGGGVESGADFLAKLLRVPGWLRENVPGGDIPATMLEPFGVPRFARKYLWPALPPETNRPSPPPAPPKPPSLWDRIGQRQRDLLNEINMALPKALEIMQQRIEAAAAGNRRRRDHVRGIMRGMMGGDGAALQLPGAFGAQSAQAYTALARAMMQQTAKKTDEEILQATREQLQEEKRMNEKLDQLLSQLDLDTVEIR